LNKTQKIATCYLLHIQPGGEHPCPGRCVQQQAEAALQLCWRAAVDWRCYPGERGD